MDEATIDLKDIFKVIKKRRRLILGIFLACTAAAAIISLLLPPTYEAETNLRVKQPKSLANSMLGDLPGSPVNAKQLMSTYAEILKSRTVVQEVINKTQADNPKPPKYADFVTRITTQPVKDTEILKVKVQAQSSEEASEIANVLVQTFSDRMTFLVRSEQTLVREFIGQRLKESKKEVEQAETKLEEYKRKEKIVSPDDEMKALVDRLSTIDKMSAENRVAIAASQAKAYSADQQLAKEKPGFIADSPLIQQYKANLSEQEVKLITLQANYTEKHPEIISARAAIDELRSKLATEIARVVNAEAPSTNPIHQGILQGKIQSEVELAAFSARQSAIGRVMSESEQMLTQLPAKEQGLARVLRDATVAREIYVMLAKRHEEARINEVMQPTDVQVIDVAIEPDAPIKPRKMLNTMIGAILGLFAGLGTAFALEYMNKTIRTPEDVQQYLDLPVLGSIPDFDSDTREPEPGAFDKLKRLLARSDDRHHHHDS